MISKLKTFLFVTYKPIDYKNFFTYKLFSLLSTKNFTIQSFLQAYNNKEKPPLLPHDLVDEEHDELLPPSLRLSSAHCNTLEHDGDGDNHIADGVEPELDETDKLFLINLFSGPTISGHTPPSPT